MIKTFRAVKFLFVGPMILLMLVVINYMTSPGEWWVQWAALGIGIAWFISPLPGGGSSGRGGGHRRSRRLSQKPAGRGSQPRHLNATHPPVSCETVNRERDNSSSRGARLAGHRRGLQPLRDQRSRRLSGGARLREGLREETPGEPGSPVRHRRDRRRGSRLRLPLTVSPRIHNEEIRHPDLFHPTREHGGRSGRPFSRSPDRKRQGASASPTFSPTSRRPTRAASASTRGTALPSAGDS